MNHYETFYRLHHKEAPLILANAWNVKSAQLIGVAGINLEDSQGEEVYLKKLSAIKNSLKKNNQRLFYKCKNRFFFAKSRFTN
jgi:2-methylisocitrate lyase-like PEP mutase family enzyme